MTNDPLTYLFQQASAKFDAGVQPIDPHLARLEAAAKHISDQRRAERQTERRREQAQAARILHGVCTGLIDQPAVPWEWALDVLWDRVTNGDGE